jgi:hypothetical protein
VLGGGAADLLLGSGDREGPDCFSNLSEGSSPHKMETYVLFSYSFGVLHNIVNLHCLCFNIKLPGASRLSWFKKIRFCVAQSLKEPCKM